MMFLGAFLFILFFVMIAPQIPGIRVGTGGRSRRVDYGLGAVFLFLLLILVVAPFAGMHMVRYLAAKGR